MATGYLLDAAGLAIHPATLGLAFLAAGFTAFTAFLEPSAAPPGSTALFATVAAYALGSFFQFFFYAQVVSETFAMAMVLAAVSWRRTHAPRHLWLAAACGVGVFLSWPVWIAPAGAAVLAAIVAGTSSVRSRMSDAAVVVGPVTLVALLHASTHAAGASIIRSSRALTRPSAETLGAVFVALGVVGAILAWRAAASRPLVVLLAVIVLQGLALAALDVRAGSRSFYMPFKMVYLAVLPCAVLGALALARGSAA